MLTKTKTSTGFGYSLNGRPVGYVQTGATTRTDIVPTRVGLTTGRVLAFVYTAAQAAKLARSGYDVRSDAANVVGTLKDAEAILAAAVGA